MTTGKTRFAAIAVVVAVAVMAVAAPVAAQVEKKVQPWFQATAGFGTYGMGTVNEDIGGFNDYYGTDVSEIKSGMGLGAGVGCDLFGSLRVGFHYQRLFAKGEEETRDYAVKFEMPANVLFLSVEFLPKMTSSVQLGIGASGGAVIESGRIVLGTAESIGFINITGSGTYVDVHASLDLPLGKVFTLTEVAGYRYAVISDVKMNDEPALTADGQPYEIDYSGLILAASLRVRI